MSTLNPFDLLGDDDNDDPSQLIAAALKQKEAVAAAAKAVKPAAKMPTKPVPPSQAVRDAKSATDGPARGGAGRGGFRGGRGGRFQNRDFSSRNENGFNGNYRDGTVVEERDGKTSDGGGYGGAPRQPFRGGARRSGFGGDGEGDAGGEEYPSRRPYERRSGTGRGYEMKREGAGRANWGNMNDDFIATQETKENASADEKVEDVEKPTNGDASEGGKDNVESAAKEGGKDNVESAAKEEKPEDKEMTLEEYEKIREEKRKALLAMKAEERKVTVDKELESMQPLSVKKANNEIFVKLGVEKEAKKKESDREEKAKKSVSIHEFLKGDRSYGRGRGRGGRGERGGRGGGVYSAPPPAIGDNGQFPTLGARS